jgi:hypothetical protein
MLILFVGIFTIICVVGAVAVDFGLWFSERRGAQTDADLPALAGAQEYMRALAVPGYPENALGKAQQFFNDNNEAGNASLPTPIRAISPCVKVWVKHDTKRLFTSLFPGVGPNNIGASAEACAGAISSPGRGQGIVPIEMGTGNDPCFINGEPQYAALCLIESGSTGCPSGGAVAGNNGHNQNTPRPTHTPRRTDTPTFTATRTNTPTSTWTPGGPTATPVPPTPTPEPGCNPHGIIDLQTGNNYCSDSNGSGDISDLIRDGAIGTCRINTGNTCDPDHGGPWYNCVAVQPGNTNQVLDGFRERLAQQGPCDVDNNGYESFDETVDLVSGSGPTGLYEAVICSDGEISARIITIIVLDTNPAAGNSGYPIRAFAALYLLGCWDTQHDGPPPSDPTLFDQNCSNQGHQDVYGEFLKLTLTDGDVETPPPNGTPAPGTLFGVALVE